MIIVEPICTTCFWYRFGVDPRSCLAFDNIPDSIWNGKVSHENPVKGDNGIRYVSSNASIEAIMKASDGGYNGKEKR